VKKNVDVNIILFNNVKKIGGVCDTSLLQDGALMACPSNSLFVSLVYCG
jgi:hypothetical protein